MTTDEATIEFLKRIPSEYPKHMLCFFAANAAGGVVLPFLRDLVAVLARVDTAAPGYCAAMLDRIAAVPGTGQGPYEAILQILSEIYVTGGALAAADVEAGEPCIVHEPGDAGEKNPECEVKIAGRWCAIEVKTPQLINHRNSRGSVPWQLNTRMAALRESLKGGQILPRDNPVKDFLISADAKFTAYERYRPGAFRLLIIVWDDFCNEPIAALLNECAGLLTPNSFHKDAAGIVVTYPYIDGIIVVRHQHQLLNSTRCQPLVDGLSDAFGYHHKGFPPKAFIAVPGGRVVPQDIILALNAVPIAECIGAEYMGGDAVMWIGGDQESNADN